MAEKVNKNRAMMAYHHRAVVDYRAMTMARFSNEWQQFRVIHEREIKFRIDLAKVSGGRR